MKTEFLIAERKVAEQALFASEQRNRALLASTSDYVYSVTVEGGRAVGTAVRGNLARCTRRVMQRWIRSRVRVRRAYVRYAAIIRRMQLRFR